MSASNRRRWGIGPLRPAARALPVVVAAVTALATGAAGGAAAPLRSCTPTHGTIVAVDFAHWGGPIVRGCGVGRRSGYDLLHAAGFTTAGDAHDGPAVVCRLGDAAFRHGVQYPTPNQDNCVATPPTSRYWAFWVAPAGSTRWRYSPLGALGDVPRPGEVELWIFGATNVAGTHGTAVPAFSPATLRARAAERRHAPAAATTRSATGTTTTRTAATRTRTAATRTRTAATRTRTAATTRTATTRTRSATTTTTRATATTRAPAATTTAAATPAHRAAAPPTHPAHAHRGRDHRRAQGHTPRPHRATADTATTPSTTPTIARAGGARVVAARPTTRRAAAGAVTPLIIGGALVLALGAGAGRAIWLRWRER